MSNLETQWGQYLDIYGANMGRWPETPSAADKKIIMKHSAYKAAAEIDRLLDQVEFPELPIDSLQRVHDKIQSQSIAKISANWITNIPRLPAAVRLMTLAIVMLTFGAITGVATAPVSNMDDSQYNYYTMGPLVYSYAYEGDYNE